MQNFRRSAQWRIHFLCFAFLFNLLFPHLAHAGRGAGQAASMEICSSKNTPSANGRVISIGIDSVSQTNADIDDENAVAQDRHCSSCLICHDQLQPSATPPTLSFHLLNYPLPAFTTRVEALPASLAALPFSRGPPASFF